MRHLARRSEVFWSSTGEGELCAKIEKVASELVEVSELTTTLTLEKTVLGVGLLASTLR
jgi:hypothetical protein